MAESVVIEVYRVGGAYTVAIMREDANGAGHGYRICGPKLGGRGERVARHTLDNRDARSISGYLAEVQPCQQRVGTSESAPVFDAEGRCLVCSCEWRDTQIALLRSALDGVVMWVGTEDWTGPRLPADLAAQIANAFTVSDAEPRHVVLIETSDGPIEAAFPFKKRRGEDLPASPTIEKSCPGCRGERQYEYYGTMHDCGRCAGTGRVVCDVCSCCGSHRRERSLTRDEQLRADPT